MIGKDQDPKIGENTQFKPGKSGNPEGRPRGAKSLKSIIMEMEQDDFNWDLVPIKEKERAQKIGAPWRAIVYTAIAQAMSGNVKAMAWLQKSGYGDKIDITSNGESLAPVVVSDIKPHVRTEAQTAPSDRTGERSDS